MAGVFASEQIRSAPAGLYWSIEAGELDDNISAILMDQENRIGRHRKGASRKLIEYPDRLINDEILHEKNRPGPANLDRKVVG